MKKIIFGLVIFTASQSFAQWNFWNNLVGRKCHMARNSCQQHLQNGCSNSGIYKIVKNGTTFDAFCDQQTRGGGWMLVKRIIPQVASTSGWSQKISKKLGEGTLGSSLLYGADYNMDESLYPTDYSRHMVYRYHSSGSTSWIWDFQLSSPLSSFGTTAWAALPDLYVNGSPKSNGIYRNQSTLHIYTNLCGTGSGTGVGGGEVGFCSEVNKAMNNEWGSATFNASDYSSSNRMITNTAYWNSSLGFVVFIR